MCVLRLVVKMTTLHALDCMDVLVKRHADTMRAGTLALLESLCSETCKWLV